jgi:hypothetical protein
MGFIVEIVTGPAAGRKFDVPEGATVSVGRTEKSRFVIADDTRLSGAHFSIECRGGKCKLRDLSSTNGTFVNGAKIAEAEIGLAEVIAAGSSTFRLRPGAIDEWIGYAPRQKAVLSVLYGNGQPVFVVLDTAREDRLPAFLQAYGVEHAPLSEGDKAGQSKEGAPYVVLLPKTSPLLKLLMDEGWGKGWGVFVNSAAPFGDVRKHLRRLLTIQTEDGRFLYYRFYDPRVVRGFFPISSPEESAEFFGPISRFVVEGDDLAQPLQFKAPPRLAHTKVDRTALKE